MHVVAACMSHQTEFLLFSVHLLSAAHARCGCGVKGVLVRNSERMPFGTLQEIVMCCGGEGMLA